MIRKIKKRDGKIDDFNPFRITNAIWKAAQAVGGKDHRRATELTEKVLDMLEKNLKSGEIPSVEQVQDTVEKVLIEEGHAKTAKAYILYRHQHKDIREIGGLLKDIDVVDDYLSMMDWKVNENSNMSYSLQGLNVYATENIISHYWLNKIYPPEIGEAHSKGDFHIHDLGTLGAYTYYGQETVIAKINEKVFVTSFKDLYEKLNQQESLLSKKDEAWAKYPVDVQVLDKNGWTSVTRVVKKAKNKAMHFIKNEGGRSVIVTEDHPMVLGSEMFKQAKQINKDTDKLLTVNVKGLLKDEYLFFKKEIKISEELIRNDITDFWVEGLPYEEFLTYKTNILDNAIISTSNTAHDLSNTLTLTEDFGYLVGFYIAEGWMEQHRVSIKQKDTPENKQIITRLKQAAYGLGCRPYIKTEDGHITLQIANSTFTNYVMDTIFDVKGISKEKRLPANILQYDKEFVRGVIAGIIDGDGSVNTARTSIVLQTTSRTLLEQMSVVLNLLGFTVRDRNLEGVGSTRTYNGRLLTQHYPMYGISFRTLKHTIPSLKYHSASLSTKAWRAEGSGWHKVLNNEQTEIPDDYIYDITTESHTLIVNGMWNHNCVGWDLKDILLKGFKGVSGKIESKPAKHFGTALMQIVNYLYTLQGEAAGAQALSNFDSLLAPFIKHDNLNYKQVKQEMQKFMYNMNVPTRVGFQSLAYDESVVFRKNGKIKVELIGKLIEEHFGENRQSVINNVDGYGNPSNDSFAVKPNDTIEVISFDKDGNVGWNPVKALIKHKVNSNGFKRIRTGSGEVKVSPAHSLFKMNSGHIKPVMAKDLKCTRPNAPLTKDDHVLAVNKLNSDLLHSNDRVDLFDLIEELPEKIQKRIFIKAEDVPEIKEKILTLYSSIKEFLYKNGGSDKSTLYSLFKENIVPFEMYMKYSEDLRKDARIYIKPYNKIFYDRYLTGQKLKNFVTLVAWFITEGKASHSNIVISQRIDKNKEILEVADALGIKVTIDETKGYSSKKKTETGTVISNMKMSGLYASLLPFIAGATAREKTIPSFIFDLKKKLRDTFLETLFKGDGYHDEQSKRITYSSISDKLLTSISLLCTINSWRVRVITKNKERAAELLIYKNPKKQLDIQQNDIAGSPVYDIEEYKNDWNWEYDISVDTNGCEENFVGGTGLVFYHNSPFTNITMDITAPSYMKDEPVIIGGKPRDTSYKKYQEEMDMINKAFAEIMIEGDAQQRPFTFPIPTYNITNDFDWENEKLEPLWEMTAKYGIPYFSNFINSDMKPEDARSMCCRLRLSNKELRKRGGGLFGANPKTGSIGVVTINLPRIGYLASDEADFFNRLDKMMNLAKESLIIKREIIENLTETGLHPYSRFYLADIKKAFGQFWKNHFSTIGLIGMNDALLNFMNKSIGDPEGEKFAEKIMDFMRKKISDYQKETNSIFNLEATPAEGSLAPDEQVLVSQSNPRFTEIGPLIDNHLKENKKDICMLGTSEVLKIPYGTMFTYGFSRKNQKIKKYPVTALVRHPAQSMYEITTSSGRKVKVTGQHSVFTLNKEGVPEEILISDITAGDPIAVPKKINMDTIHTEINVFDLFKESMEKKDVYGVFPKYFVEKLINNDDVKNWCKKWCKTPWKDRKQMWRKKRVIPLELLYELNINPNDEVLNSSTFFYRRTKNTAQIKMKISLNNRFGFIIGSLLSQGWLSDRCEFNNTDKSFAEQFYHDVKEIFGKDAVHFSSTKQKKQRKTIYTVTLSKSIGLLFKQIGLQKGSNEKRIPNLLFHTSDECVKGLLNGYYLGDGSYYENHDNNDPSIRLYTNSKKLSEGLNLLLIRLGILTKLKVDKKSKHHSNWKDNYVIIISGAVNLETYFKKVLKKKTSFKKIHSDREVIPLVPRMVKQLMERYSIKPTDISISKDRFNKNIRKERISHHFLQEIIQKLSVHIVQYDEKLEQLKTLIQSDISWDKVTRIKEVPPPDYVYDFEVDVKDDHVNNFIGGSGLVCLHNTSYRLARVDKQTYPDIRVYNQENYRKNGDKDVEPYYTNSSQLPVGFTTDVFKALDLQDGLQSKYTGGTVLHIFLGENAPNPTAVKQLVRKVAENYELPYYTITPTFSVCPDHGYIPGEHEFCPKCEKDDETTVCEVYSRVVGYLRPVNQWNKGKQREFNDRKTFTPFDKKSTSKKKKMMAKA